MVIALFGRLKYVAIVMAVLGLTAAYPIGAYATHNISCSETSAVSRFAGWVRLQTGAGGVAETIDSGDMRVCTSSTDDNRADHEWVALDDNGANSNDIVQVGVIVCYNSPNPMCGTPSIKMFEAWGRSHLVAGCSGYSDVRPVAESLGLDPGGPVRYKVVHAAQEYELWANGIVQDTVPLTAICWTTKRVNWLGESWDYGDAIGGSSSVPSTITLARYQSSPGSGQVSPGWTSGSTCNTRSLTIYKCPATGSDSFSAYTIH